MRGTQIVPLGRYIPRELCYQCGGGSLHKVASSDQTGWTKPKCELNIYFFKILEEKGLKVEGTRLVVPWRDSRGSDAEAFGSI